MLLLALLVPCLLVHGQELRIFNGEDAADNKFVVYIGIQGDDDVEVERCGGVAYSKNVVLTSARCVVNRGRKVDVADMKIIAGVVDTKAENKQEMRAQRIMTHRDFKGGMENDIAVIILDNDFEEGVEPVQMAEENWNQDYTDKVVVMGWGGTEEEGEGASTLQQIEYSYSNQEACQEYWKKRGKPILKGMFCTGGEDEEEHAWKGDEGGPVMITDSNGEMRLAGLVSWGNDRYAPRAYDVNTDVVHFKEWIEKNAGDAGKSWIELRGGLNEGVVLLHDQDKDDYPVTVCNHKVGQKELNVICNSLGYTTGVFRSARDYMGKKAGKRGGGRMPEFGATDLECTEGADKFSDGCTYKKYPDEAEMPCFPGNQLAVQCGDDEWKFEFTHMETKSGARGRAICRFEASMFGSEIDVKREVMGMLVNVKQDSVEKVDNMKYKPGKDSFIARFKDVEHSCLACVAMVRGAGSHFNSHMLEHVDICKLDHDKAKEVLEPWIKNYKPEDD